MRNRCNLALRESVATLAPVAGGRGKMAMAQEQTHPLDAEIRAYDELKAELEKAYAGKFVVIKDGKLVGAWDTLDAAAQQAVVRFGRGPYLIRQVGAPRPTLPASVLYRPIAAI